MSVFARGMLDRAVTRVYFPGEEAANPADEGMLRSDIHMQGENETGCLDM